MARWIVPNAEGKCLTKNFMILSVPLMRGNVHVVVKLLMKSYLQIAQTTQGILYDIESGRLEKLKD